MAEFEQPGTFPKPGPIGRVVRLFFGLIVLYFFVQTLTGYSNFVAVGAPGGTWWLGAAVSFYLLREVIDIGFGRSWGRRSQVAVLALALAFLVLDLLWYGIVWGRRWGC